MLKSKSVVNAETCSSASVVQLSLACEEHGQFSLITSFLCIFHISVDCHSSKSVCMISYGELFYAILFLAWLEQQRVEISVIVIIISFVVYDLLSLQKLPHVCHPQPLSHSPSFAISCLLASNPMSHSPIHSPTDPFSCTLSQCLQVNINVCHKSTVCVDLWWTVSVKE